jgi:thioredoxin-like negative regulator of GroEL
VRDPRLASAWGFVEVDAGRPSDAIALFHQALAIEPRLGDALFGIAEAAADLGHIDEAATTYRRYLAEHPHGAYADRARTALELIARMASPPAAALERTM